MMLKNVYLFTGEERYLLDFELHRWTSNFSQKFGKDSVFFYHNENWDEWWVNQSIFGWWLFSEKKLIVIDWLPVWTDRFGGFKMSQVEEFMESFMKREWKILEDNLLIFVSTKPDKRSRFYKFLKDKAILKEFSILKEFELKNYIKKDLWNIKISDALIDRFIQKVGYELYRVRSELEKLKIYCDSQGIDEIKNIMIDDIVFGLLEAEVFEFLKLIFVDKIKAIDYLQKMKDQWLNWNAVSGLLYRGLKLYIVLYEFAKKGIKDTKVIANQTGINPYTLMQNIKHIDIIQKNWIEIENMYKRLIEIEVDIKNGKKLEASFRLETKKLINSFKL